MINPSANGWIDKFLSLRGNDEKSPETETELYLYLRETGFIYGHVIAIPEISIMEMNEWKSEEISKAALVNALYLAYSISVAQPDKTDFYRQVTTFYKLILPKGFDWLGRFLSGSESQKLEEIIDQRIQTNRDIISKNFSHIITNIFLFADVLAFRHYLLHHTITAEYLKTLEEIVLQVISLSLKVKTKKSQHDELLIKLFEASVRYSKFSPDKEKNKSLLLEQIALEKLRSEAERYYVADMAGLALWNDGKVENEELYFMHKLAEAMQIDDAFLAESIEETNDFITEHKEDIHYFNYTNPVRHFYDQTTKGVIFLIKRNKKRLTKEISESKELMQLLAKSAKKDLSAEEKKKVKNQLLDICKSIPSLTIFLLPGGGLLLPLLIKFIPQLLPSAFNENLEED